MVRHEVTILDPGIRDLNTTSMRGESQFMADIYIQPPVTIGAELGKFIGGAAGSIIISEVTGTEDGNHVTVACAKSRESNTQGFQAIAEAVGRLRIYFDTEPLQLGVLGVRFAQEPLLVRRNSRQM